MRRAHSLVIIGLGALAAVSIAAANFLRQATPAEAAAKALVAYESQDATSLFSVTESDERRLYGLTPEKISRVLQRSGFGTRIKPSGKLMEQTDPGSGSATVSRWYTFSDGTRGLLSSTAEIREEHRVVVQQPVTNLIYTLLYQSGRSRQDEPKPATFLKGIEREASALTAIGIEGVADEDSSRLLSWSELRAQFEKRLEKYNELHAITR